MTINSLSNTAALTSLISASSTSQSSCGSAASATSSDGASLSGSGQLMAELKKLSESDPSEFKKITAEIATQLQSTASSTSDSGQASFLNSMASNFEKASQSGNFSDLFPQQGTSGSSSQTGSSQGTQQGPPPPPPPDSSSSSATSSSSSSQSTTGSAVQSAYGNQSTGSGKGDDAISQIFANALAQIQSDLGGTSSLTSSGTTSA